VTCSCKSCSSSIKQLASFRNVRRREEEGACQELRCENQTQRLAARQKFQRELVDTPHDEALCNSEFLVCRDIFEDILHWINLGLTKYFAQVVKTALHGKTGEQVVLQRMRDLDWSAFDYRLTSNPVRYCGSYQGKDFQVCWLHFGGPPFHCPHFMTCVGCRLPWARHLCKSRPSCSMVSSQSKTSPYGYSFLR
jgi:hypothetical protein